MTKLAWLCLAPLLALASPAFAQIRIENAWSRATPPGATIGVGYLTIRNGSSAPDKLVSASSPAAGKVETHVTFRDGDINRMREVPGYDVPANAVVELKPGGAHLMLMNLKAPLKEGDKVPLVLKFQRAGEVKTELRVESMGGMGEAHGAMEHGH